MMSIDTAWSVTVSFFTKRRKIDLEIVSLLLLCNILRFKDFSFDISINKSNNKLLMIIWNYRLSFYTIEEC